MNNSCFILFDIFANCDKICVKLWGVVMIMPKEILDEKNKKLRKKSHEVIFPITDERKKLMNKMIKYLVNSQIEKMAEKYNLRPGMGLAAIQLGIEERFFVISHEITEEDSTEQKFNNYIIINPKVISYSEELIYASVGEGCLSVNREVEGIIPRYARITIEYTDEDGNKKTLRAREELAIAIQHEMDHLEGILFFDRINKENPFKDEEKMRMI